MWGSSCFKKLKKKERKTNTRREEEENGVKGHAMICRGAFMPCFTSWLAIFLNCIAISLSSQCMIVEDFIQEKLKTPL